MHLAKVELWNCHVYEVYPCVLGSVFREMGCIGFPLPYRTHLWLHFLTPGLSSFHVLRPLCSPLQEAHRGGCEGSGAEPVAGRGGMTPRRRPEPTEPKVLNTERLTGKLLFSISVVTSVVQIRLPGFHEATPCQRAQFDVSGRRTTPNDSVRWSMIRVGPKRDGGNRTDFLRVGNIDGSLLCWFLRGTSCASDRPWLLVAGVRPVNWKAAGPPPSRGLTPWLGRRALGAWLARRRS